MSYLENCQFCLNPSDLNKNRVYEVYHDFKNPKINVSFIELIHFHQYKVFILLLSTNTFGKIYKTYSKEVYLTKDVYRVTDIDFR